MAWKKKALSAKTWLCGNVIFEPGILSKCAIGNQYAICHQVIVPKYMYRKRKQSKSISACSTNHWISFLSFAFQNVNHRLAHLRLLVQWYNFFFAFSRCVTLWALSGENKESETDKDCCRTYRERISTRGRVEGKSSTYFRDWLPGELSFQHRLFVGCCSREGSYSGGELFVQCNLFLFWQTKIRSNRCKTMRLGQRTSPIVYTMSSPGSYSSEWVIFSMSALRGELFKGGGVFKGEIIVEIRQLEGVQFVEVKGNVGVVRITSCYPTFNGSNFDLPPSF